jgi:hypothetical protein
MRIYLVFELPPAPAAEEGFLATWLWYEEVRKLMQIQKLDLNYQ